MVAAANEVEQFDPRSPEAARYRAIVDGAPQRPPVVESPEGIRQEVLARRLNEAGTAIRSALISLGGVTVWTEPGSDEEKVALGWLQRIVSLSQDFDPALVQRAR